MPPSSASTRGTSGSPSARARTSTRCYDLCVQRKIEFFADVSTRFDGLVEVHRTFVLRDPSDNLVEFKHYADPRMMY